MTHRHMGVKKKQYLSGGKNIWRKLDSRLNVVLSVLSICELGVFHMSFSMPFAWRCPGMFVTPHGGLRGLYKGMAGGSHKKCSPRRFCDSLQFLSRIPQFRHPDCLNWPKVLRHFDDGQGSWTPLVKRLRFQPSRPINRPTITTKPARSRSS